MNGPVNSKSPHVQGAAKGHQTITTTEADLEMMDETESEPAMLEMVPIGKIEEVSKQKRIERRNNSIGAARRAADYNSHPGASHGYSYAHSQSYQAMHPAYYHHQRRRHPDPYYRHEPYHHYEVNYDRRGGLGHHIKGYQQRHYDDYDEYGEGFEAHYGSGYERATNGSKRVNNWGAAKMPSASGPGLSRQTAVGRKVTNTAPKPTAVPLKDSNKKLGGVHQPIYKARHAKKTAQSA